MFKILKGVIYNIVINYIFLQDVYNMNNLRIKNSNGPLIITILLKNLVLLQMSSYLKNETLNVLL